MLIPLLLDLLLLAPASIAAPHDPGLLSGGGSPPDHGDFDFWVGEWSVQNRHLQPDRTWGEGDVTRARITPVCGGKAILEEWAGPFRGGFMNGFSLRAYDPAQKDWGLLLFWTTDGNAGFGHLRGTFRHGRGEFFSGQGEKRTRYTFSDALAESVRWDHATTEDGGVTWKTGWIMEFSRTLPAAQLTQDRLFDVAWTEGKLSPHAAARRLDWMLGGWQGMQTDLATGEEREARLRCKLLDKDCLVLDLLETRAEDAQDWDERLAVRGYVAQRGAWESYTVSEHDTRLRSAVGQPAEGEASFESPSAKGGARREVLRRLSADVMVIEEEVRAAGATEFELVRVTELQREQ